MSAVAVLGVIALAAAIIAAGAVTAMAMRGYALARRWERLADQIGEVVEGELKQAVAEVATAARGIQGNTGNIDRVLHPLSEVAERLKRSVATFTVDALVGALLARTGISGVWRGIAELVRPGRGADGAKR